MAKFDTYLRWHHTHSSTDGGWEWTGTVDAIDHGAAAAERVEQLARPLEYDSILIAGGDGSHPLIRQYRITEATGFRLVESRK